MIGTCSTDVKAEFLKVDEVFLANVLNSSTFTSLCFVFPLVKEVEPSSKWEGNKHLVVISH